MEDDLKKIKKNGKRPKQKWKTNQSTKINLIGCDTIVNSPSYIRAANTCYNKCRVCILLLLCKGTYLIPKISMTPSLMINLIFPYSEIYL